MKFDVVIGNPPYNQSTETGASTGNTIYQDFMKKCMTDVVIDGGYLCFVNPPSWRKPLDSDKTWEVVSKYQFESLHIHSNKDGMAMFGKGTRYDYYLINKVPVYKPTAVVGDDNKEYVIDFREWEWLPNSNFELVKSILGGGCEVIYSRSDFGADKKWVSHKKDDIFKYPLVHSTTKKGVRWCYSSRNDGLRVRSSGSAVKMFGVPKIIFGEAGINGNSVIDLTGEFGMTQGAFAIKVYDEIEAINIQKALHSDKFNTLVQSCIWSSFRIDWSLFKFFRNDFWKEFV